LSEFDLIGNHFTGIGASRPDVPLGVGDDCALMRVPEGTELAVSIDTLVAGVHFLPGCDPEDLGHKCLAVGLSDLAAMGAEPVWATLALTLPRVDDAWLKAFSAGFSTLASHHGVALVGGDTTRGPLCISVQVHGLVPAGQGIRRDGARPGDLIYVSGTLGDAGLALRRLLAGEQAGEWVGELVSEALRKRLERPTPRVAVGKALRGAATAMIDLSDGLAADLGHILKASGVGAEVRLTDLPLTSEVAAEVSAARDWSLPLSSGDDYELCFTVPQERGGELEDLARRLDCALTSIGRVTDGNALVLRSGDGSRWVPERTGYDHFSEQGAG
jgi:thiamine-monophosphate kinase